MRKVERKRAESVFRWDIAAGWGFGGTLGCSRFLEEMAGGV